VGQTLPPTYRATLLLARQMGLAWENPCVKVRDAIKESLGLLTGRDRRLLLVSITIQMLTSFLDLFGVLLMGAVGALAVSAVQSQPAPAILDPYLDLLGLQDAPLTTAVVWLAGIAAVLLISKSVVSALLNRRVFRFLANRQALVSGRLFRQLMSSPLLFVQSRSSQETAYALIGGASAATVNLLSQFVVAASEIAVLALLGIALLALDPLVTLGSVLYFAALAIFLQRLMGSWASRMGAQAASADVESLSTLQDSLGSFRELRILGRADSFADRFERARWTSAQVGAGRLFMGQVPKYIFEGALVLGGLVLAAALFATKDAVAATGTLVLFLTAASRVTPSLLRLQGATLLMRDSASAAAPTFEFAADLDAVSTRGSLGSPSATERTYLDAGGSRPAAAQAAQSPPLGIELDSVFLRYPGANSDALHDVSLQVVPGSSLAIVGPSGAGKSSLVDVTLGLVAPTAGTVRLSGQPPPDLLMSTPGRIAYVPQSVHLLNDTIRANIAIGLEGNEVQDHRIWRALEQAHAADFVRRLPDQLDSVVGDGGARLSGGQRQRLGIARAMLVNPSLLVMDEATSALDADSEAEITRTVSGLKGRVTTLVIAHRLSTVREADQLLYLSNGEVKARGTFDEVRRELPTFERQARLLGML
jgi:ABC-type multidrug transport system fused ATPase/permease subunit